MIFLKACENLAETFADGCGRGCVLDPYLNGFADSASLLRQPSMMLALHCPAFP